MHTPNTLTIIFLLGCFLSGSNVFAQTIIGEDVSLQPSDFLEQEQTDLHNYGNNAYLKQIGDQNDIYIHQVLTGDAHNLIYALQDGNDNMAKIAQIGNHVELALIQQGDGNLYELLNQEANNNKMVAIQEGNTNTIVQHLINSNQINTEFVQRGNNNEIIQELIGIQARNYKIHQIGDDQQIIIRQSSAY